MDVKDFEPGGGGPEGIGSLLQSGSAVGVAFQGRDVGPDPLYGAGPYHISEQGRTMNHWEDSGELWVGELGLSSAGGRNGGSGL